MTRMTQCCNEANEQPRHQMKHHLSTKLSKPVPEIGCQRGKVAANPVTLTAEGVSPRSRNVREKSERAKVFLYITDLDGQHHGNPRRTTTTIGWGDAPREREGEVDRLDIDR